MAQRIAIHGAAGRMGRRLIALGSSDAQLELVAGLESANSQLLGSDLGQLAGISPLGLPLTSELPIETEVVIDFSVPEAALALIEQCVKHRIALVVATTGFEDSQKEQVESAARQIPMVWAPNMSLAVNLTMQLAATAGRALKEYPGGADVEIIERHHRFKEDAPSGTALKFGEMIAAEMGQQQETHGRQGRPGERPRDEIGYHALRVGDDPGQHTIVFGLMGEKIELTVGATNRDSYAQGALAAAKFLAGKPAGLYSMADVLGL